VRHKAEMMNPSPCYLSISLMFVLFLAMGLASPLAAIGGFGNPNKSIAYVTNGGNTDGGGSVSLIDIDTRRVLNSVPLGGYPIGVAIPDRRSVYVTGFTSNTVTVFDQRTLTTEATIPVCAFPGEMVFTPDRRFAYVPCVGDDVVSVIDTRSNAVATTVSVGADSIAITPDGKSAYATDINDFNVSVIDTKTNTVVDEIPLAGGPTGIAITPDGKLAVVEDQADVSIIDTRANKVVDTVPAGGCGPAVAITPDGKLAYVSDYCDNVVSVIDIPRARLITTLKMDTPSGLAVTPDGNSVYVVNNECPAFPCPGAGTMSIIKTTTNHVFDTITVGVNPQYVAFDPTLGFRR
jgi:YVTN family beta-propeller protein